MDNMEIYNKVRSVPQEALRKITAGRLKGKSDVNPMWRIKALTENFGPCGIGWRYVITDTKFYPYDNGEVACFVTIDLSYRDPDTGEWSNPVPGVGGNKFAQKETGGIYVNDECVKMALTDAISVAAKALGVGADVYWQADATKYTGASPQAEPLPVISYEDALNFVPDGFDRPLAVLWKENFAAVTEIGLHGTPQERSAVAVINAKIKEMKAAKQQAAEVESAPAPVESAPLPTEESGS